MLFIIEGPDGSGKTSLCNAIKTAVGGSILKRDKPVLPPLIEYTAALAKYEPGKGQVLICDRWHLGERVYGPLYRGGCGLSPIAWAAVEGYLQSLGAICVLATAPPEILADRLRERGEQPDSAALLREKLAFDRAVTWSTLPWITYDSVHNDVLSTAFTIIATAKDWEQDAVRDQEAVTE